MQQRSRSYAGFIGEDSPLPVHFGAHLRLLRDRYGLSQHEIVTHLAGWQQAAYSKVEKGTRAPLFEELPRIYRALKDAGIQLTRQDREYFYVLACALLESRKTRHARQSDEEWNLLYAQLTKIDGLPAIRDAVSLPKMPQRARVGQTPQRGIDHLLGREAWLTSIIDMIVRPAQVKVLILQGPPGCGKTSELHRLANHFLQQLPRYYVVLSEPAPIQLEHIEPADVLERLLGDVLDVVGSAYATMPTTSLQARTSYVLDSLTRADRPVIICLDNAEQLFDGQGKLEPIWQRFLTQFAQVHHRAALVVASQEWPVGTFLAESQLVVTVDVPLLSQREGSQLLQTLGLRNVPEELLGQAVSAVGGMPVCLEWMVRLVREPFLRDEWAEFEEEGDDSVVLTRLLDDPALFDGSVAQRVQPLLDRVLKRLSVEATTALQDLAVAPFPLGATALKVLYQSPKVLRELRESSLLVAYPQRAQLLPMVAAQVRKGLTNDQVRAVEERLIQALSQWLPTIARVREQGSVVTELTMLLLKHQRLLEAAEMLIEFGWLSSGYGQGKRLAERAFAVMADVDWRADPQKTCGGIFLRYYLGRYRGEKVLLQERAETYQHFLDLATAQQVPLKLTTIAHLVQHIANFLIVGKHFAQALELLDSYLACNNYQQGIPQIAMLAPLLKTKAHTLNAQGEWAEEQEQPDEAKRLKEEALHIDQQCVEVLRSCETSSPPLTQSIIRYHLARTLNEIGYFLVNLQRGEEAMKALEESIQLKSQGYTQAGSLAMSVGEMGQALELAGKFQEALRANAAALEETQRLATSGHTTARGDIAVHLINRARLLLRVGQFEEAERLVHEALPDLRDTRSIYRKKAQEVLDEMSACRATASDLGREYLDWRWYPRYKQAIAFDVFGWLTHAGPFSAEEEQEWKSLRDLHNEQAQERREQLMKASRDRELEKALAEEREPRLLYPAIRIEDVQTQRASLQRLADEIREKEPNAIVRRLYREAIEEQVEYLQMVEATFQGDCWAFWEHNRRVHAEPTREEMETTLRHLLAMLARGSLQETTRTISESLLHHLQHIYGSALLSHLEPTTRQNGLQKTGVATKQQAQGQRFITPMAAKLFFEAVLSEYGFADWRIQLDHATNNFRIEANIQTLFLPAYKSISVSRARDLLGHELEFHVLRAEAGKRTPLALLAEGTRNFLTIDEGMAVYYDQQTAQTQNQILDEASMTTWIGTLATGLAAGVLGAPQTFLPLQRFLESLYLLDRLLSKGDGDLAKAKVAARRLALNRCLRTLRGVPDLTVPGVCYVKDAIYLRGYLQVQQAIKADHGVLDRLMVGKIAYEHLQDMEELDITVPSIRPRWYAHRSDLDEYILSFDTSPAESDGQNA